ncbi:MAG TPA: twin-arginine translocase TatA/TatE family subunit [Candidatus Dormibacteraeota bacterium]|nr:twin-arginine translocase TatA/TatE family subunit [Candidatus Dormibacteraeota bacterium]
MLSVPHMIVVFIIVLVVFGPQKLPELARSLGKLLAEFRKASADFRGAFEEEMRDLERQAREVERKKAADTAAAAATPSLDQPTTQGTPAGAETQSAATDADSIAGAGLTEAPVTRPVAESVPRSDTASDAPLTNHQVSLPTETPASTSAHDAPHDRQPA